VDVPSAISPSPPHARLPLPTLPVPASRKARHAAHAAQPAAGAGGVGAATPAPPSRQASARVRVRIGHDGFVLLSGLGCALAALVCVCVELGRTVWPEDEAGWGDRDGARTAFLAQSYTPYSV
jgi:hypothetical protein